MTSKAIDGMTKPAAAVNVRKVIKKFVDYAAKAGKTYATIAINPSDYDAIYNALSKAREPHEDLIHEITYDGIVLTRGPKI